jgi:hypothetical protein
MPRIIEPLRWGDGRDKERWDRDRWRRDRRDRWCHDEWERRLRCWDWCW